MPEHASASPTVCMHACLHVNTHTHRRSMADKGPMLGLDQGKQAKTSTINKRNKTEQRKGKNGSILHCTDSLFVCSKLVWVLHWEACTLGEQKPDSSSVELFLDKLGWLLLFAILLPPEPPPPPPPLLLLKTELKAFFMIRQMFAWDGERRWMLPVEEDGERERMNEWATQVPSSSQANARQLEESL